MFHLYHYLPVCDLTGIKITHFQCSFYSHGIFTHIKCGFINILCCDLMVTLIENWVPVCDFLLIEAEWCIYVLVNLPSLVQIMIFCPARTSLELRSRDVPAPDNKSLRCCCRNSLSTVINPLKLTLNSLRKSDAYMCQLTNPHWFR